MISQDIADFISEHCGEESTSNLTRRSEIIARIQTLAIEWSECEWTRLMVFGSTLLGVLTAESDIDTVLVLPSRISREQVFSDFVRRLDAISASVVAIPDAHVPVLKLNIEGFEVDILTAHLGMDSLRQMANHGVLSLSQRVFEDVDYTSLLSLNGVRVGYLILEAVNKGPEQNTTVPAAGQTRYKRALQIVKHWAKRRGIYSNALGFFGGITWAILVAKIFQTYVISSDLEALDLFFNHWASYAWSSGNPVSLRTAHVSPATNGRSQRTTASETAEDGESLWDPAANEADRKSLMPVLTPAVPFMNSTFNTMNTNARILKEEFRRASEACGDLVKLCELVQREGLALKIAIECPDKTKRAKWFGLVESKLRVLITHLEAIPGVVARPFPDPRDVSEGVSVFEIGISFFMKKGGQVDFRPAVANFRNAVDVALSARSDHEDLLKNCRVSIFIGH